jgi:hypothetical protein
MVYAGHGFFLFLLFFEADFIDILWFQNVDSGSKGKKKPYNHSSSGNFTDTRSEPSSLPLR